MDARGADAADLERLGERLAAAEHAEDQAVRRDRLDVRSGRGRDGRGSGHGGGGGAASAAGRSASDMEACRFVEPERGADGERGDEGDEDPAAVPRALLDLVDTQVEQKLLRSNSMACGAFELVMAVGAPAEPLSSVTAHEESFNLAGLHCEGRHKRSFISGQEIRSAHGHAPARPHRSTDPTAPFARPSGSFRVWPRSRSR